MAELKSLRSILNDKELLRLATGLQKAVMHASVERRQNLLIGNAPVSGAEQLSRMKWCADMAVQLYRDKHWPLERIIDWMPNALVQHLDGMDPVVSDRGMFVGD